MYRDVIRIAMRPLRNVCVFCGSSPGARPEYADMARRLGRELVARDIGLVFGGGNVGLMGVIADAVLDGGGDAIGVIPKAMIPKELAHERVTELRIVATMHERKAQMAELSDAFIALPGGLGTLEELFEVATWGQLGYHDKAFGLLDVAGYYAGLAAFLDHAVAERFLTQPHRDMLIVGDSPGPLLDTLAAAEPTTTGKWIDRDQL